VNDSIHTAACEYCERTLDSDDFDPIQNLVKFLKKVLGARLPVLEVCPSEFLHQGLRCDGAGDCDLFHEHTKVQVPVERCTQLIVGFVQVVSHARVVVIGEAFKDHEFDLDEEQRLSDGEKGFRGQTASGEVAGNGEGAEDSSKELRREEGSHRRK